MSWLLDVNSQLASRWTAHADHTAVRVWLSQQAEFYTTPIVEHGFMRVSLSPGYTTYSQDAHSFLLSFYFRPAHRFLADDLSPTESPESFYKDTTDAHLVCLAVRHGLKLATLDMMLLAKSWASGQAFNPILETP